MLISEKDFLFLFGWDDFFESQISSQVLCSLIPARVICEEKGLYRVQSGLNQIFWASIRGKMQFDAKSRADYPAIGDWVLIERDPGADRGVIHQLLQRKSCLQRKQVGASSDIQILSANVNYAFLTSSLNEDLNARRIERYLAVAYEAGVTPVLLLTKADLCAEGLAEKLEEIRQVFLGVPVHAVSKDDFEAADFLKEYLRPGTTSVFLGSSGVGKSTLVNFLIDSKEEIKTQEIRESDGRGRHTTTSRHLYVSRYDGLIIDTPGMRELQLSDHQGGLESQFAEVEELIPQCRFRDCRHESEPDCAVTQALEAGDLSAERWRSYQKLEAEVRYGQRRRDKALLAEDRKAWKKMTEIGRERGRLKRGERK